MKYFVPHSVSVSDDFTKTVMAGKAARVTKKQIKTDTIQTQICLKMVQVDVLRIVLVAS